MSARMEKAAAAEHYTALLDLERTRNYQARISGLQEDNDNIMDRIKDRDNDLDRLSTHYRRERILVDEELEKLKLRVENLLTQFTMFAKCKLQDTNEVEIYSKLLDFEQDRLSSETQQVRSPSPRTVLTSPLSTKPQSGSPRPPPEASWAPSGTQTRRESSQGESRDTRVRGRSHRTTPWSSPGTPSLETSRTKFTETKMSSYHIVCVC